MAQISVMCSYFLQSKKKKRNGYIDLLRKGIAFLLWSRNANVSCYRIKVVRDRLRNSKCRTRYRIMAWKKTLSLRGGMHVKKKKE